MSQSLAYFYTFAALREFQQERGADFLLEQRAQNMVLILKLKLRGPEKGKRILAVLKDCAVNQAAQSGLCQDVCSASAHVLTGELSLTSGFL